MQRRLAAILAADVVGYSRLMEQDEAGTLALLKARRKELAPVKAHLRQRMGAAVAEIGGQDHWQRATLLATLKIENRALAAGFRWPWGSSVFAVGRKPRA